MGIGNMIHIQHGESTWHRTGRFTLVVLKSLCMPAESRQLSFEFTALLVIDCFGDTCADGFYSLAIEHFVEFLQRARNCRAHAGLLLNTKSCYHITLFLDNGLLLHWLTCRHSNALCCVSIRIRLHESPHAPPDRVSFDDEPSSSQPQAFPATVPR